MNITANAASLDWRGNNKGTWKALVKDLTPDTVPVFDVGYTATVSGRTVTVQNATAPVGVMTYETDLADAVSAGALYGAGSVSDSLEAVAGDKTVRMGSVDLGTLDWTYHTSGAGYWTSSDIASLVKKPSDNNSIANIMSDYYEVYATAQVYNRANGISVSTTGGVYVANSSSTIPPSGILYYELATPTTSTETSQSLSLTTGDDTLSGGSFDAAYEGTDYDIVLEPYCKFLYRNAEGTESVIPYTATPSSRFVHGGVDKLINLTRWFGEGSEPSIVTFYDFYPTWKNYDIPYNQGSVLNYKGTGVQTIGFNAYDHVEGTAALLGGNKYQICGTYTSVSYVDVFGQTETITPDSDGIFTPTNDGILTVVGGNNTDTCVHLCWSGYKNYGKPEYKYEPFTSNVKELPILTHYPDGMNGFGSSSDELTTEQKIVRWGVKVFNGTESFTVNGTTNIDWTPGDMTKGSWQNGACSHYMTMKRNASATGYSAVAFGTSNDSVVHFVNAKLAAGGGTLTVEKWQAYLTEQYNAGTPVTVIYPLATPVVTQIDQPLNLAYPVNDFGTEHSLPQNTTTLVTTDLKALIKYNTDYMRMNSQLSGIFPTVKSLARQEQDGYIMKKDDTAPNAIVGGAYNLIDRNAEGTERQFSYDTSGGTQDITDGTAVAKKSMGTTLNLNQLVHDTNQNTVTGNGQVEVEDAVVSDVASLVVSGRSLVKNQLVSPTTERTVNSSDGIIAVNDGIVESAKGLKLTAARSVVVNQLCDSRTTTGWVQTNVTITFSDNVYSVFSDSDSVGKKAYEYNTFRTISYVKNHKYAIYAEARNVVGDSLRFGIRDTSTNVGVLIASSTNTSSTWQAISAVGVADADSAYLCITPPNAATSGDGGEMRNMMCVDLTQYFNGDQTLIDSITSWDDLVAYDQRFASYVEYNTGEVSGVTPIVKVSGNNLLSYTPVIDVTASGDGTSQNIIDTNNTIPGIKGNIYTASLKYQASNIVSSEAGNVVFFVMRLRDGARNYSFGVPSTANGSGEVSFTYQASNPPINFEGVRTHPRFTSGTVRVYDVQLELGSSATAYEPYHDGGTATSPQELFAVGTAADNFEAVTGKLTHQIRSYTFTGNETWQTTTPTQHNHNVFYVGSVLLGHVASFQVLCSKYVNANMSWNTASLPDKVCMSNNLSGTANILYVVDDSISTPEAMAANMAGSIVYYELATPTEELLTPASITLQKGNNVALQSDGGRTVPFNLTYDGTLYNIALDSTHKYAFSDNGTKSIITSSSTQAVNGDEDMLVDVTRMFNGDSTAITAITSWNDMAAVMPEYNSTVAYNEGEVVGRTGGVTTVRWNQLVQNGNFSDGTTGWSLNYVTSSITNNVLTCTATAQKSASMNINRYVTITFGHKVIISCWVNPSTTHNLGIRLLAPNVLYVVDSGIISVTANTWTQLHAIGTLDREVARIGIYLNAGVATDINIGDTVQIKNVQIFDLTEIYGAGHEPSTVEEFEADCAKWGKDLSQYQPYDAGTPMGGSATFSDLHGVGDVKETLDVVTGEKQVKYGSVDLGSLTWTYKANDANWGRFAGFTTTSMDSLIAKSGSSDIAWNIVCDRFLTNTWSNTVYNGVEGIAGRSLSPNIAICTSAYGTDPAAFKASMSGVYLYYELAEPTTASLTPQPLTFAAGLNNVHEENMDITGTPVTMEYTGTDYVIATKSARKYIKTIDGTTELVTGVSSVDVRGGRDNLIDLTRMFGSGLEPGTLDAFYSLFPAWRGYRLPYNKGSLLNFKGTGLKSVGFNQFSGEYSEEGKYLTSTGTLTASTSYNVTDYLRAVPGQTYRLTAYGNAPSLCWYTYDKTFISGTAYGHASTWQEDVFTAPANAYWVRFSVYMPREAETCFYFQWSGTRNGDYEPYWDYVRPIPTLTYFPDGMNGRRTVYDEINPRQAVKRFGRVDLGTLNWTHTDSGAYGYWESTGIASSIMKPADHSTVVPMMSSLYVATSSNNVSSGTDAYLDCIGVRATSGNIRVNNGSTTESPTGWLVYELANPIVTSFSEEISATARISDYGTEECLPVNGYDPVTAPFRGMVLYQDDYARTITKLPENYQSQNSMDNLLALIGPLLNGTITATFDSANQVYTYQFTPNA